MFELENDPNIPFKELDSVGIRLNKKKPEIYFKQKKTGGITFTATCNLTRMDEKMVRTILHEYKIHNAEVLFREDSTPDDFIDVINGKSIYMPCIYVYNKIDQISLEDSGVTNFIESLKKNEL